MKRREKREAAVQAALAALDTQEHLDSIERDADGNEGLHRVASHSGADYVYISSWYGMAMCSVAVSDLTGVELAGIERDLGINVLG
jgi:hypothetical protein